MQTSKTASPSDRALPGRPREFDIDEAVESAILVFRSRGYHGTSVQDLTEGTGLARGSLYKAFHDKRTLFLAALDHYTTASLRRVGDALNQPGSARWRFCSSAPFSLRWISSSSTSRCLRWPRA